MTANPKYDAGTINSSSIKQCWKHKTKSVDHKLRSRAQILHGSFVAVFKIMLSDKAATLTSKLSFKEANVI